MRKTAVVAVALLAVALTPGLANAQSSMRTNIRGGDVWTLDTGTVGGFVEWMISWTKKADFDLLIEGSADGGATFFTVCRGQSTQDGFERCHYGVGQTTFTATIVRFSGANKAKGAIWISVTNSQGPLARVEPKYRGNIYDKTDDSLLLGIRARMESRPVTKRPTQR